MSPWVIFFHCVLSCPNTCLPAYAHLNVRLPGLLLSGTLAIRLSSYVMVRIDALLFIVFSIILLSFSCMTVQMDICVVPSSCFCSLNFHVLFFSLSVNFLV